MAMEDSIFAAADEHAPLVTITGDSDLVTWNEDGTKVLMLSWNHHPECYIAGQCYPLADGEIWAFTDVLSRVFHKIGFAALAKNESTSS